MVIRVLITRKFQNTVNVALISVLYSLLAPALLARDLHPGAPAAPVRPNLNGAAPLICLTAYCISHVSQRAD